MVSLISQFSALGGEILLIVANALAHILYSVFSVLVSYRCNPYRTTRAGCGTVGSI